MSALLNNNQHLEGKDTLIKFIALIVTLTSDDIMQTHTITSKSIITTPSMEYGRSDNFREVLIFVNFARRTNSRIHDSLEHYLL